MRKVTSFVALVAACSLFVAVNSNAEEPLLLKRPILTMDAASKVALATIRACRKEGMNVTVTVIGRNSQVMAVLGDTLSMEVSLDMSKLKAVTALSMNSVTGTLASRYKNPAALEKYEGLLFMAGGVPINAGGNILGAVGVSGSPSATIDEKCALEGIKAISTDLELAL